MKNYEVFDNNTTLKLLSKMSECDNELSSKTIFIVAGTNGCGKSTYIANLYKNKELEVEYVNSNLYANTLFKNMEKLTDQVKKSNAYTLEKIETYVRNGKSFCYEIDSTSSYVFNILKLAKQNGYKINLTYIFTNDPQIEMDRISPLTQMPATINKLDMAKLRQFSDTYNWFDNSENKK